MTELNSVAVMDDDFTPAADAAKEKASTKAASFGGKGLNAGIALTRDVYKRQGHSLYQSGISWQQHKKPAK